MFKLIPYQSILNNNNINQYYIAYTTRDVLDDFKILTFGYVKIEDHLLLLTQQEDEQLIDEKQIDSEKQYKTIQISSYIYSFISNIINPDIIKCPIPCKPYDENSEFNLLPDFPICKDIQIQILQNRNSKLITQQNLKAFLTLPFVIHKNQIIQLTLYDEGLIGSLQLKSCVITRSLIKKIKKSQKNDPLSDPFIYIQIKAITSDKDNESNYFLFSPQSTQLLILNQKVDRELPKQQLNLGLMNQIYNIGQFRDFQEKLDSIILLNKPISIAIETQKNLGKRLFFKMQASKFGYNYFEKDISQITSIKFLLNFFNKIQDYKSIVYLRNFNSLIYIMQLKNTQAKQQEICEQIINIKNTLLKQNNKILIICNDSFSNYHLIKSDFDVFIQFTPKNNEQITQLIHQYHSISMQLLDFHNLIKDINWRIIQKQLGKDNQNFYDSFIKLNKQLSIKASVKMEDIGGMEGAINEVAKTVILPQLYPQLFDELVKPRRGVLFFGPPGTGKTLLAKCIATEMNMSFISVKGPEMLNMYIGESESNIRDLFKKAQLNMPTLIFFDELDALAPARGNRSDSNQVMDRIVAQLLTEIDNISEGVFIIGATNRPDLLDPALMRPGRFDKLLYMGIKSDRESRVKIIRALTKSDQFDDIVDEIPQNFTGADFYGLVSQATIFATRRCVEEIKVFANNNKSDYQLHFEKLGGSVKLEMQDLKESLKQCKPSVSEQDLEKYEQLKQKYE